MEAEEPQKEQNLFDFGDEKENDDANKNGTQKKKVNKKPQMKLDAQYLMENSSGLKFLYKHFVTEKDKHMNFRGKGNE